MRTDGRRHTTDDKQKREGHETPRKHKTSRPMDLITILSWPRSGSKNCVVEFERAKANVTDEYRDRFFLYQLSKNVIPGIQIGIRRIAETFIIACESVLHIMI